jgi:hypothetical protein
MNQPPIAIRHRTGAEWTKHIAGRALADRAAAQSRAEREAIWRFVEEFIPCG